MSTEKYAVVIDRPYYPSVELFDTLVEAEKSAEILSRQEDEGADAKHDSHIYVVTINRDFAIRTSY